MSFLVNLTTTEIIELLDNKQNRSFLDTDDLISLIRHQCHHIYKLDSALRTLIDEYQYRIGYDECTDTAEKVLDSTSPID